MKSRIAGIALAVLLAACGGGGGGTQRGGATSGPPPVDAVYDLHVSIAQAEPACVAPVGQAWDLALSRDSSLPLYADDGNHSRPAGAFLAALVLYATITGKSPLDLPNLPQYPVDAALQEMLRGVAAETVATVPPRMWCPNDPA